MYDCFALRHTLVSFVVVGTPNGGPMGGQGGAVAGGNTLMACQIDRMIKVHRIVGRERELFVIIIFCNHNHDQK